MLSSLSKKYYVSELLCHIICLYDIIIFLTSVKLAETLKNENSHNYEVFLFTTNISEQRYGVISVVIDKLALVINTLINF